MVPVFARSSIDQDRDVHFRRPVAGKKPRASFFLGDAYAQKGKSATAQAADLNNAERVERLGYQTKAFGRTRGWCKATGTKRGINLDEKQLMMQPARLAMALHGLGGS